MKVALYYPDWGNRWADYVGNILSQYHTVSTTHTIKNAVAVADECDLLLSMWCNEVVSLWSHVYPEKKIVSYLRRHELWNLELLRSIDFNTVDALIFVSQHIADVFTKLIPTACRRYVIPNGVALSDFPLRTQAAGTHKIALVANAKAQKNLGLVAQILLALPNDYTVHHIGNGSNLISEFQDYLAYIGMGKRYVYEGQIHPGKVAGWLQDKDFILSTSISEGNPNCLIEAMAMGIRPVIHGWPGALDQFPRQYCFRTVQEATDQILDRQYEPEAYRQWVTDKYSLANFERLNEVITEVASVDSQSSLAM